MKPRWKRCVENVDGLLGDALGRKYVEKNFPPEAKARMQEMVKNILLAMKDTITGLTWMGDDTKKKALEKLSTFNPKIGYPDKWKAYAGVVAKRGLVLGRRRVRLAVERRRQRRHDRQARRSRTLGHDALRPRTPTTTRSSTRSSFPPGSSASGVLGRGDRCRQLRRDRRRDRPRDQPRLRRPGRAVRRAGKAEQLVDRADLKKFQARGQCVVDQFEGYFIEPGIHHNGKLVLGESIGDLAGAKLAFLAYRSRARESPRGHDRRLHARAAVLHRVGTVARRCDRPETQRTMIQGDPHPIAKYRVIGPLSNLPRSSRRSPARPTRRW
jgi:endothelin-converting enzyme/putative endopeptidase